MADWYLVGEPLFGKEFQESYFAPIGQVDLAYQILSKIKDGEEAVARLREEYLAIVYTLKQMGINFRIICAHQDQVDQNVLSVCIEMLGCRLSGFPPEFFPPAVIYPRDFATVLPNIVLVNSQMAEVQVGEKEGYKIISSPYGEGGRVLPHQKTMLVGEKLIIGIEWGHNIDPQEEIEKVRELGIKIGIIPLPVCQIFSKRGKEEKFISNDHLDRVGCLLEGKDNGLYLVLDPLICTADYSQGGSEFPWVPRLPWESMDIIKRECAPLEINVRCPRRIEVPYSLNLIQFPDRRVLMTAGDDSVAETIAGIVGEENVNKTPIPIELFPVWCYAGIRCLVNETPEVLFKKV